MPVPRLSTLTMSLDLLDEITRKSNIGNQFEADSTNPEKNMVCLQNGFGDDLQHNKYSMRRNVIPYPDHNYGQPPPPTPPEPGSPDQNEQTDTGNEDEDETGITKCICGFEHTDEYMICCDKCSSWQHIECMGIKSDNVPDNYLCNSCQPRTLDVERAKVIQSKKKEEMSDDDNYDDDDDSDSEEDQPGTMYTAVSSTPTRITLTANTLSSAKKKVKGQLKKSEEGETKRKRRNSRKRQRTDTSSEVEIRSDSNSVDSYRSYFELYKEIAFNKYHPSVESVQLAEGLEMDENAFAEMLSCRTCQVDTMDDGRKGLVALQDIPENKPVLEYKGMVMLLSAFEEVNPFFRRRHPYVLFYNGLDHMELAVDARTSGNESRFIRRSCDANAEIRHVRVKGLLRFVIYSKRAILDKSELTIPFEFPVDSYDGRLECTCNKEGCIIAKFNLKFRSYEHRKKTRLSNGEAKQRKISPLGRSVSENQLESESDDNEVEAGSTTRRRRKLSREERKLQTYMKQFEKMEKEEKKGGTVVPNKDAKEFMKDGRLSQLCRFPDGSGPRDENGVLQMPKLNKRSAGRRRISMHKRRSRVSSCSSEPLSPAEDSNSLPTPTTPLTVSTALSPVVDMMGGLKPRSRKDKDPLSLALSVDRISPNLKTWPRKCKKEALEVATGSPTPPATPNQASPTGKVSTPIDPHTSSQSPDVSGDSTLFPSAFSTPAGDKSMVGCGLLQVADQSDDTGSKPNSPVPTSISSIGMVTAEELVNHISSRGDLICEDGDSNSSVFKTPLRLAPCKYFGSMKKHWLQQHTDPPWTTGVARVNGINHLPLSTLISTRGIGSRATQIASKSLSRFAVAGSLKKKRLHEIIGYSQRSSDISAREDDSKSQQARTTAKSPMDLVKNELLNSPLGQIAQKFIMANPITSTIGAGARRSESTEHPSRIVVSLAKPTMSITTVPFPTVDTTSASVTTSSFQGRGSRGEGRKDPRLRLSDMNMSESDWRDEKPASIVGLLSTDSSSTRYGSTSSRDSIESVGFTRSDSVSSVEESGSSRAERDRGKKKMSLSEYRNRQRARPPSSSISSQPICMTTSAELITSQTTSQLHQSIFSETESLLIPRTVSLSNSYITNAPTVKLHVPASVSSTNPPVETVTSNGPVFEPVSPSDVDQDSSLGVSGMHFIKTRSFAYPTAAVVSTTGLSQNMQRTCTTNQDGSASDAMDIEDEDMASPSGIQVSVPNSIATGTTTLIQGIPSSQTLPAQPLIPSSGYNAQITLHHHFANNHGSPSLSRKNDSKLFDLQQGASKRTPQMHPQPYQG